MTKLERNKEDDQSVNEGTRKKEGVNDETRNKEGVSEETRNKQRRRE